MEMPKPFFEDDADSAPEGAPASRVPLASRRGRVAASTITRKMEACLMFESVVVLMVLNGASLLILAVLWTYF